MNIYNYFQNFCFFFHNFSFYYHTGCHIENTETNHFTRILPLAIWSKEDVIRPNKIMLMIRAKGVVLIPLLLLPATSG